MSRHLLVVTRDVAADSSARYLLRHGLALARRQNDVTVFLTDDALSIDQLGSPPRLLDELMAAGAHVMADARIVERRSGEALRLPCATEQDLASLLLTSGLNIRWC